MWDEVREVPAAAERTLAADVARVAGRRVALAGWVHRVRSLGNVTFVLLRDRSGLVQCVFEPGRPARNLTAESVVRLEGLAVEEPRASGGVEVRADRLEVLAAAPPDLPFPVNYKNLEAGLDVLLDERALSLRHLGNQAIFHVQAVLGRGFGQALTKRGFLEVHTPKLVAGGTEGGAELFPVRYFGRQAFLAQSPQFYKQMLAIAGFERVYEVGPVFRAESHNTSRHANEFTSLDYELAFIDSDEDVMELHESVIAEMLERVATECGRELDLLGAQVPGLSRPIPRLAVPEACRLLEARYGWESAGGDINPEGERLLGDWARSEYSSEFLFLTQFPAAKRPAYTKRRPENPTLTRSFDLLFRGLEITTGGQRIDDHAELVESFRRRGLDPADFASYVGAFRFGAPPHGGSATGLERLTGRLLGLENIREACLFPRDCDRLTP